MEQKKLNSNISKGRKVSSYQGDVIKQILNDKKVTISKASKKMGITQPYLSNVKNNNRKLSIDFLFLLGDSLGIPHEQVLGYLFIEKSVEGKRGYRSFQVWKLYDKYDPFDFDVINISETELNDFYGSEYGCDDFMLFARKYVYDVLYTDAYETYLKNKENSADVDEFLSEDSSKKGSLRDIVELLHKEDENTLSFLKETIKQFLSYKNANMRK